MGKLICDGTKLKANTEQQLSRQHTFEKIKWAEYPQRVKGQPKPHGCCNRGCWHFRSVNWYLHMPRVDIPDRCPLSQHALTIGNFVFVLWAFSAGQQEADWGWRWRCRWGKTPNAHVVCIYLVIVLRVVVVVLFRRQRRRPPHCSCFMPI